MNGAPTTLALGSGWDTLALAGAATLSLTLILLIVGLIRRWSTPLWYRLMALALLGAAGLDPRVVVRTLETLPNLALVVVDRSLSNQVSDRPKQGTEALAQLQQKLASIPQLSVRTIDVPPAPPSEGTHLFEAIGQGLADAPRDSIGAIFVLTDGLAHDVPADLGKRWNAPIHVLLTGSPKDIDRRIDVLEQPDFTLVGENARLRLRAVADGETVKKIPLTIAADGQSLIETEVQPGRDISIDIPIRHTGKTMVEIAVAAGDHELSLRNNRRIVALSGIRDRLKVLLLSGTPHTGERVWRNLFKSDPAVDLVHFTILRSPDVADPTPLSELALINFPVRELFEDKLSSFDLVVLDRYRGDNLPIRYLDNLGQYVKDGGALLVAAGPEFADRNPLMAQSDLGALLPAANGPAVESPFRPQLSDLGRRHPVTAQLASKQTQWGRWLRYMPIEAKPDQSNQSLLSTPDNHPLLMLQRVGEGRFGLLLSDSAWTWARGWENGGPHRDLTRRLAHWLMKEPELEEEALSAALTDGQLTIQRQSLSPALPPITVTDPDGGKQSVTLTDLGDGRQTAHLPATVQGMWRVSDGTREIWAVDGDLSPLEWNELIATNRYLGPVAQATGGFIGWMNDGLPDVRTVGALDRPSGRNWAGIAAHDRQRTTGMTQSSAWPRALLIATALILLCFGWIKESR